MAGALLVLVGATAVVIYAGLYNIAADVPHTQPVYWLFEAVTLTMGPNKISSGPPSNENSSGRQKITTSQAQAALIS